MKKTVWKKHPQAMEMLVGGENGHTISLDVHIETDPTPRRRGKFVAHTGRRPIHDVKYTTKSDITPLLDYGDHQTDHIENLAKEICALRKRLGEEDIPWQDIAAVPRTYRTSLPGYPDRDTVDAAAGDMFHANGVELDLETLVNHHVGRAFLEMRERLRKGEYDGLEQGAHAGSGKAA